MQAFISVITFDARSSRGERNNAIDHLNITIDHLAQACGGWFRLRAEGHQLNNTKTTQKSKPDERRAPRAVVKHLNHSI